MLGAGDLVWRQGPVYLFRKPYLYPLGACLKAVRGPVIEGDPVREYPVGVKPLDQKQGLGRRREPFLALYLPDLCLKPSPFGDKGIELDIGKEILIVGQMRGVYGYGGDPCIKHGWYLGLGLYYVVRAFYRIVVGMYGHRHGYAELVHRLIDKTGHIPVIYRAIGVLSAL